MTASIHSYSEAIGYLDSLAQFGWKLDLSRITRLCELAGNPQQRFPSILVGGSAGKGSTCAVFSAILRAAGYRVGTAPKPHLVTHRERVQVQGELIDADDFARHMEALRPLVEQVTREHDSPTVFEVMTLLAFRHFAQAQVDWAVVEVGLGGRLDATNVLVPRLAVITTIGLDHTDRLGDTVEAIAFEKAGILKPDVPALTGATGGALEVIRRRAAEVGAPLRVLGEDVLLDQVSVNPRGTRFRLQAPEGTLDLHLPLLGAHQAHNAALAAAGALWLGIGSDHITAGVGRVSLPGRLETVHREPRIVLDGAHSPDRARALAEAMRQVVLPEHPEGRLILVIGCSRGHAPAEVVTALAPLSHTLIATQSEHPHAVPVAEVAAAAGADAETQPTVARAVKRALELARPQDVVLITGSLFVVGEAVVTLERLFPPRATPGV